MTNKRQNGDCKTVKWMYNVQKFISGGNEVG